MKKVITLLLSVVLVFGVMAPSVLADTVPEGHTVQPRYLRMSSFNLLFDIDSNGKSTCYCYAESKYATDTVSLTMELQRLDNGIWNTIKTWSGSGTCYASLNKNWYVTSGYEYQIKVTVKVYNSSGTLMETQVDYAS